MDCLGKKNISSWLCSPCRKAERFISRGPELKDRWRSTHLIYMFKCFSFNTNTILQGHNSVYPLRFSVWKWFAFVLLTLFPPSTLLCFSQVMQVVNADAMVVKLNSGEYKTIHLSSIRPPRIEGEVQTSPCRVCCVCVTRLVCTQRAAVCLTDSLTYGSVCGLPPRRSG